MKESGSIQSDMEKARSLFLIRMYLLESTGKVNSMVMGSTSGVMEPVTRAVS